MSAAPQSGLSPGSLVIPVIGDLAPFEKKMKEAEDKAENAARRVEQKMKAQANRVSNIQKEVGGPDDDDQIPESMQRATKAADSASQGFDKTILKLGAVAAAGRVLVGAVGAIEDAFDKARRGEVSFNEALQDTAKGIAASIPIIGNFFDAGVRLRQMWDGVADSVAEATAQQKVHAQNLADAKQKEAALAKAAQEAADEQRRNAEARAAVTKKNLEDQFSLLAQLEEEYDTLTKSEEELLVKKLQGLDASKETIELARKLLAANKEAKAQKDKEEEAAKKVAKAEEDAKAQKERAEATGKSRIEQLEKELAVLQGQGKQYEENRLRSMGVTEEDIKRINALNDRVDKERQIEELERKRFTEVSVGAAAVDARRTVFGASSLPTKIKTESPDVVKAIDNLRSSIKESQLN